MNSSRINAKSAKSLSEEIQKEVTQKNLREKAFQTKFEKTFQKLTVAAVNYEISFDFSDEDTDFLYFCFHEFKNLDFHVEIRSATSDKVIQEKRSEIEIIQSNMQSIAESASTEIEKLADILFEFTANKTWLVQVYGWLSSLKSNRPLLKPDWHSSSFESLRLVQDAERDKLLSEKKNNFQEQSELRSIIFSIGDIHQSARKKIEELKGKIFSLEKHLTNVDEDFRCLDATENIEDYKILSMRIGWGQIKDSFFPEDSDSRFLSPNTLFWCNSTTGQRFLDFMDERIRSVSSQGKKELTVKLINDSDGFFILNEEEELISPSPRIFEKIYSLLGFKVKKLIEKNIAQSNQTFTAVKLIW